MADQNPTGVVMLNLGGPRTLSDVGPFLRNLFLDREIIQLPAQERLGPFIARRRTPKLQRLYQAIGGGSPLYDWTTRQGEGMVKRLDALCPETAPHRFYLAFRYTEPSSEHALRQMAADGVRRAVAFSQYPQYSCSTTGSSLGQLWRDARRLGLANTFQWSVIDRWSAHPSFVRAMTAKVREGLGSFPETERRDAVVLFSAHSLPRKVINQGDPYLQEVAGTVRDVMRELDEDLQYALCFQADVGPVSWQGPNTESVLEALGKQGRRRVLIVGIVFTTDHLDTLSEIDIEFAEVARNAGITEFHRAPAPNDDPLFLDALAQVVADHLRSGDCAGPQFGLRCHGCANESCREILNPAHPYRQPPLHPQR
ncbi:ferrochelatase [Streptomyces sp. LX-29]|uniref:ferrochelatase n=1 Tax=Streptomyces sp. LX-29 TaxID=2900152 RepID=UPI00240D66F0|nr:ferrochelatase [Streptomyces sp. LX-29]